MWKDIFDSDDFNLFLKFIVILLFLAVSMLPAQYHLTEQAKQSITQGR